MKKFLIGFLSILIIIILYGFFVNPIGFTIKEQSIEIVSLEENFAGFKIVQISDILIGSTKSVDDLKETVKAINELKPDIIVFTGDLINDGYKLTSEEIANLKKQLSNLECTLYKYAVMGDNDQKQIEIFQEVMKESNFIILDNESSYIFYEGNKPIKITGLTNLDNVSKALEITDNLETALNIVLTHYPDYVDNISNYDVDIVFSGHSLKGQVRVPFIGGIMKKDWANKYLDNYYEVQNTKMYVSGGLGTETIQFRLFNKPEINLYRLNAK